MKEKIDSGEVKRRSDVFSLANSATSLKKEASTEGGEWSGPCPFCGGKDRFRVQPYRRPYGLWMCHHCTNSVWKDAIDLGRRLWPELRFSEICGRLAGDKLPTISEPRMPEFRPAAAPPPTTWQQSARLVLEETQAALWQPKYKAVLDYLHIRGLQDETIKHFGLGYCSTGSHSIHGREIDGLYIPRGIVIPGKLQNAIWYLKIRLMPGIPCWCSDCKKEISGPGECPTCKKSNKYKGVKGNRTAALFNAEQLDNMSNNGPALFVEGEFDCMVAWQELGDLIPVITLGSAYNKPDLATWGRYFVCLGTTLLCYDNDEAGQKGATAVSEMSKNAVLAPLPTGPWKDVSDFYQTGGNIRKWISEYLDHYNHTTSEQNRSMVDIAKPFGGVVVGD